MVIRRQEQKQVPATAGRLSAPLECATLRMTSLVCCVGEDAHTTAECGQVAEDVEKFG
jgi:hypothetical protein